ncbi:MFS transporter [Bosea rubneri]
MRQGMETTATHRKATKREWVGLAVIALPCLLYAMDLTVLNLAVPHLTADLRPSASQLLWIVDIYGFMVAGALVTMGTLGDRIGRRKLLLIGAAAFGLASIVAAFSTSAPMLIATRALLGLAGATLAPSTLSLIRSMFEDPDERRFAIGIWISSFSAGGAIGPLAGGLLLEHFWWGSVFLANVPVMVLLLILGPLLLPEYKDPDAGSIDLPSAVLSVASVLALIYGLKRIAEDGLAWLPVAIMLAGLAIGVIFLRRQTRLADPFVDLSLFRSAAFRVALAINVLGFFFLFGIFLFVAQYLQLVAGFSPLVAGLYTLPSALAFIVGSMFVPALAGRLRVRHIMVAGLAVAALGFLVMTQITAGSSIAVTVIGTVVFSLGFTPVVALTTDLVVSAAPPERAGSAAALSETSIELGGALGIAILGSAATAIYRVQMAASVPAGLPADIAEAARATLGGAVMAAHQAPAYAEPMLGLAREAFTRGMQLNAWLAVVGLLATAALALAFLREPQASHTH